MRTFNGLACGSAIAIIIGTDGGQRSACVAEFIALQLR
jgi:hypothetical protein